MKILLIRYFGKPNYDVKLQESLPQNLGSLPPLGLAYVAAVLENNGYDVSILDATALGLTPSDIARKIKEEKPRIVGITVFTLSLKGILEVARLAKENGAIVVLGGPHLAVYPEEILSYDFVDYGIIGEGEFPMLELVKALDENRPCRAIKGLVYRENSQVKINEPYIVANLEQVPFPARHLLPLSKYNSVIRSNSFAAMVVSRGCPHHCGFCFKQPSDSNWRIRNVTDIVDEMEFLSREYKVREIMFYDDDFAIKKDITMSMCNEILRRKLKIKWDASLRVDNVDEELLKLMKAAGCIRLRYGVESGDQNVLDLMNKDITLDKIKRAFKLTKKIGIKIKAYVIIGYINETAETITRTISFIKKLEPDLAQFSIAFPLPGTHLYKLAIEKGFIKGDYWRDFTLGLREDKLPYFVDDAEKWLKKAYRDFYFRPKQIFISLRQVRSWEFFKKFCSAARVLIGRSF